MGRRGEVTIVEWECDSCGKVRRAREGTEPKGFHGEVSEVKEPERALTDNEFKTWFACNARCIGPAVKKVRGYESSGAPSGESGSDEYNDDFVVQ